MKKRVLAILLLAVTLISFSSCSIPIFGDLFESENSLGKTNSTAVTIAAAMDGYLDKKGKEALDLYGISLSLNSDGNGTVKLFYTEKKTNKVTYSDIYVAEVDSTTGHVSRFGKASFPKDDVTPYRTVCEGNAFDAGNLPIDSEKAVSLGVKAFSNDPDFYYDYVQLLLSAPGSLERYDIRFISMLTDTVYYCTVDAVSGAVLSSSSGALEEGETK